MQLSHAALFLALGSPAAAAGVKDPFILKPAAEKSWTPARETSRAEVDARANEQWSPRPTDGPELLGRMELLPRLDGYTLSPGTCGYISSDGQPYGCINTKATCALSDGYMGCCDSDDCQKIQTTCISSADAATGACDLPDDFHTLCCTQSNLGQCFTWVFTTQSAGADETYAFLDCASTKGTALLLEYDPAWSKTRTTESDKTTSTKTSTARATTTDSDSNNNDDGGSSTNVGAIAGGVVGGVAALALVGTAAFLLLRRRKQEKSSQQSSPPALDTTQMNQPSNPTSPPPPTQTPSSPSNTAIYPSGVPSLAGGYTPSPGPYDPNNPQQQQPQPYPLYPNHTGQSQFSNQYPSQYGNQYPNQFPPQQQQQQQQQSGMYPPGAYGYPSPTSQNSPSPGAQSPNVAPGPTQHEPPQQQPQQQFASELPTVNPVGMESNRAELQ